MSQSTTDAAFAVLTRLIKEDKIDDAKRYFDNLRTPHEDAPAAVEGMRVGKRLWLFTRVTPDNSFTLLCKMNDVLKMNQNLIELKKKVKDGYTPTFKQQVVLRHLNGDGLFRENWRRVRSFALQKSFLWKYCFVVPRALRVNRIDRKLAGGIQADFFEFFEKEDREFSEHFPSVIDGETKTETNDSNA